MVRPGPTTRDPERDQPCFMRTTCRCRSHTTLEFCVPRWRYILSYTAYLDVILRTGYQPLQKRNVVESSMVGGAETGNDIYAGSKKAAPIGCPLDPDRISMPEPTNANPNQNRKLCRNRRTLPEPDPRWLRPYWIPTVPEPVSGSKMAESETPMSANPIGIRTTQTLGAGNADDGGTLTGSRQ